MKTIYQLKLHETTLITEKGSSSIRWKVTKVPGGFIYQEYNPFNNKSIPKLGFFVPYSKPIKKSKLRKKLTQEEKIIALAKKKGYKVGTEFKSINEEYPNYIFTIDKGDLWYSDGILRVVSIQNNWKKGCSNPTIFDGKKWAKIVK